MSHASGSERLREAWGAALDALARAVDRARAAGFTPESLQMAAVHDTEARYEHAKTARRGHTAGRVTELPGDTCRLTSVPA